MVVGVFYYCSIRLLSLLILYSSTVRLFMGYPFITIPILRFGYAAPVLVSLARAT